MNIEDLKAKVYHGESCSIRNCKTKTIYKGVTIVDGAYLCLKHFKDLEESLDLELELDWQPYWDFKAKKYEDRNAIFKNNKIQFKVISIEESTVTVSYKKKKLFKTIKGMKKFGLGSIFDNNSEKMVK